MLTALGVLVVLGVLVLARYAANDPVDRFEPVDGPRPPDRSRWARHALPVDLVLFAALARRVAAYRHAWAVFDRDLRPWDQGGVRERQRR